MPSYANNSASRPIATKRAVLPSYCVRFSDVSPPQQVKLIVGVISSRALHRFGYPTGDPHNLDEPAEERRSVAGFAIARLIRC